MVVHLHMGWRDVCFLNWPVDPEVVAPRLPEGLDLDTYDGRAWLSVTPFTNVDVRPWFLPRGTGLPLPEVNLRTYVRRDAAGPTGADANSTGEEHGPPDEPSVYFFSLDAQGVASVLGARLTHRLPYYYARIGMQRTGAGFRFESRRVHPGSPPARLRCEYEPVAGSGADPFFAEEGSLAAFLTDRNRYYTTGRRGELRHADVSHEPWPLHEARATVEANTLFEACGFDQPASEPVVFYSPGVETLATPSRRA